MSSELKLSGTTARVILQGNDSISSDQTFTFPDTGGEVATKAGGGPAAVGYQQGLWTPTCANLASFSFRELRCSWSRTGNTVSILGFVEEMVSNSSSTTTLIFAGIPYSTNASCVATVLARDCGLVLTSGYISETNQGLSFAEQTTGAWNLLRLNNINTAGNDGYMFFSTIYQTDDTTWTPINGATVS